MAVSAKFIADWESFFTAVDKAEVKLVSFDANASKVEKSLNRMVDNFSGRKVIQEATLMTEAIERSGGISRLTGAELQRAGALAEEAGEKMRRLGMEVPKGLTEISSAARAANPAMDALRGTASQFDGVLGALGINTGKSVKAIEDLASASGKTASQVGLMGSAGLVAGAAFAGWEVGRKIAELTGADDAVAKLTARLMGYGDVAAEVAGAKQDVINRAIANGAKETITYAEAIQFNIQAIKTAANTYTDWGGRLDAARAFVRKLTDEQIANIQTARQLGATQEQLEHDFGISADAVKALDELLQKTGENEKKLAETQKKLSEQRVKNFENEQKAAEQNAKKFANLAQENLAIELSITATSQQAKAAAIEADFQREVAKLNKLDPKYREYYALLEQQRNLNLKKEEANYDQINAISRTALQERAEQEMATLQVMQARSGEFSAAQIAQQKEAAFAAKEAWQNFGLETGKVFENLTAKAQLESQRIADFMKYGPSGAPDDPKKTVRTLGGEWITPEEAEKRRTMGGSRDVPELVGNNLDNTINRYRVAGDTSKAQALERALAQLESMEGRYAPKTNDQYFAMVNDQILLAQLRHLKGTGKIPGFSSGVENFAGGLAYVHKDEMLVDMPRGSSVIPAARGGRSVVIQGLTINANTRREGRDAGAAFIDYLRAIGEIIPN